MWLAAFYELAERVGRKQNGIKTRREARNWVSVDELQQKICELDKKVSVMHSANNPQRRRVLFQHLGLRLMTDMPSLRTQNIACVKLTKSEAEDQDGNVLQLQLQLQLQL